LQRSERLFRAFFGRVGVGAALLGLDARLEEVNGALCAMTGRSRADLLSADFAALVHSDDAPRIRKRLAELVEGRRRSFALDVRQLHDSGAHVWVRSTVSLGCDDAGRPDHLIALCEEIGAEHDASAADRREALALAIGEAPLATVLGALVRNAEARVEAGAGVAVFLRAPDGDRFELAAAARVPRAYTRAIEGMPLGPGSSWCAEAAHQGRTTIVADVTSDPRWAAYRELALENGIRACCAFPIRSLGGRVLGTLAVYHGSPWVPEPSELSAGEQLAETAALLVDAREASEWRGRTDAAQGEQRFERFAAVFQQAGGGIACTDAAGRFEVVNDRYCQIVGRSRAELASLRIQDITHPDDRARHRAALRSVTSGGPPWSFEQRYVRPSGSITWVRQDASVVRDAAGKPRGVITICQDIHERKLAEALLLEQQLLLELVAAGRPLDDCLLAFCTVVPRLCPGVRASAVLTDASGKSFDRCLAAPLPATFPVELLRDTPIDDRLLGGESSSAGVSYGNIATDTRWPAAWRDVSAAHGVAACHLAPVRGRDRALLAFLVLSFDRARAPTSFERRLAEIGAHVASIAIERDRIASELQESQERLSGELKLASDLHELGARLLAVPDLPAAAELVLDAVLAFVGAEMGTVQIHDPSAGGLRVVSQRGFDPAALAAFPVIPPDYDSTCAQALRTNQRVMVTDFDTSAEFASHREMAARLGYRAELSSPLRTRQGEILGMLNVHFARPHQPSARELRTVELCVRPLAHWMERVRGEEALRQYNERFRTLVEEAPYGICLLDAELRIRQLNAAARRVFPEGPAPVGQEVRESLHAQLPRIEPERIEAVAARLRRTLESGEPHAFAEWSVQRADGTTVWFDCLIHRIPLPDGTHGVVAYFVDVSTKVRAREEIVASEERFRSLVSVLSDLLWTVNAEGAFVTPQPAWSAFTGQSFEELQGYGWMRSLHPDDREALWKACKVGSRYEVSARIWHAPTAQYREFVARAAPLRNADGSIREWVGSCTDVTEQRLAERTLRDASRRKDDFLAMLGHELRNPLAALRNAITLASVDEAHRESALEIAGRQVAQLGHLIDDLFDVARIEQGRITLHSEPVKLADALERAAEEARSSMAERRHRFIVAPPGEELYVAVDPARFEQVLGNLLANAARYTECGGTVQLLGEREGDEAVIRVKDDGVGIAPQLLSEIFEPFTQADRTSWRSERGLGIGLAVVRQLVELHGGRVAARSEGPGRGAEFIVRLPALAPPEPRPAEPAAPRVAPGGARVLLVEDDRDAAASMRMLLEYMGHSVRTASTGAAALEAARTEPPELVFVDIGLPDMDGYEVARCMRGDPALRGTHLVALTGYGREDDKQRSGAAGFEHHLVKPAGLDTLRDLLGRLIGAEDRITPG
jgi:PAS domain S-box-containing protein